MTKGIKRTGEEKLASDSIVDWDDRDPNDYMRVRVTCGRCGRSRYTRQQKREGWSGICRECSLKELHKDQSRRLRGDKSDHRHRSNAIIHYDDRVRSANHSKIGYYKIAYTCSKPGCGRKDYAFPSTFRKPGWSGLCKACVRQRGNPRKLVGDEKHRSDAIVHRGVRKPGDYRYVLFTCANAKEGCRNQDYVQVGRSGDPNWSGLCCECRAERSDPRKQVQDQLLPLGGMVFWSEREGERVPVSCVLCGGEKHWRTTAVVLEALRRSNRKGQDWNGYCTTHRNNGVAAAAAMLKLLQTSRLETKTHSVSKKRRGRKPGTKGFDHTTFPADVAEYILDLWRQHRSVVAITREAVAKKFQAKGEAINGKAIADRLKTCGIIQPWSTHREAVLKDAREI